MSLTFWFAVRGSYVLLLWSMTWAEVCWRFLGSLCFLNMGIASFSFSFLLLLVWNADMIPGSGIGDLWPRNDKYENDPDDKVSSAIKPFEAGEQKGSEKLGSWWHHSIGAPAPRTSSGCLLYDFLLSENQESLNGKNLIGRGFSINLS